MDATTVRLVKESYSHIGAATASTDPGFILSFYERLFAAAPAARGMFPADISVQAEKLARTLDYLIAALCTPDLLEGALRDLGDRHASLGVERAHYAIAADALLETLADAAGEHWTDAHCAAWRDLLNFVCDLMIEGTPLRPAA